MLALNPLTGVVSGISVGNKPLRGQNAEILTRSRGDRHGWEKVVAACSGCNSPIRDRTPKKTQMQLRTKPKAPIHPTISLAEQFWKGVVQANLE